MQGSPHTLRPGVLPSDDLQAFKQRIYDQINKSGLVSVLKSQLRSKLIDSLTTQQSTVAHASLTSGAEYAMAVLVCSFLSWHSLGSTLSVFDAEFGVPGVAGSAASHTDTLKALRAHFSSPVLDEAVQQYQQGQQQQQSFAAFLLGRFQDHTAPKPVSDGACQTDDQACGTLRDKLRSLDEQYRTHQDGMQTPINRPQSATHQPDHNIQQEQQQARLEVAAEWERLQRWQQQQQQSLHAKEEVSLQRVRSQQREVERVAFEHRQTLLQEQARLLAWQADCQHAYQQQKKQLEDMEAGIASRLQVLSEKEAAAEQQVLAAVQLVEQMQADCQTALDQEKQAHQAALAQCKEQLQAKVLKATSTLERLEHQLQQAEQAKHTLTVDTSVARSRASDLEKYAAKLEQQLQDAKQQVTAAQHKSELQQHAMQAAVAEGQRQLAEHKVLLDAKNVASMDHALVASTIRDLQNEAHALRQQLAHYEQQLASHRLRVQQADDLLDEAVAAKEGALQRVEKLALAAEELESENQHLRSKLATLRTDVAVRLQSPRPVSPFWGQLSGRVPPWSGQVSPSGMAPHSLAPAALAPHPLAPTAVSRAAFEPVSPVLRSEVRSPTTTVGSRLHQLTQQEAMLRKEHASFRDRIANQRKQADAALAAIRDHLSVPPMSPTHPSLSPQPPFAGDAKSYQAWAPPQPNHHLVGYHQDPMAAVRTYGVDVQAELAYSRQPAPPAAVGITTGNVSLHQQAFTAGFGLPGMGYPPAAGGAASAESRPHAAWQPFSGAPLQALAPAGAAGAEQPSAFVQAAASSMHTPAGSGQLDLPQPAASIPAQAAAAAPAAAVTHLISEVTVAASATTAPTEADSQLPVPALRQANETMHTTPASATAAALDSFCERQSDRGSVAAGVDGAACPAPAETVTPGPSGIPATAFHRSNSSSSSSSSRASSSSSSTSGTVSDPVTPSSAAAVQQQATHAEPARHTSAQPSRTLSLASSAAAPVQPPLQPDTSSGSELPEIPTAATSLGESLLDAAAPVESWHLPGLSSTDDEEPALEAPGWTKGELAGAQPAARVSSNQSASSLASSAAEEKLETALESDGLSDMHVPMGEESSNSVF